MADENVLGHTVRDEVTGFQGIAVSRHLYLHSCERVTVQAKSKDGKPGDEAVFDLAALTVIERDTYQQPVPPALRGG